MEIWGLVSAVKLFISELQNEPKHEVNSTEGVILSELKSKSKINNFIYQSLYWKKRTSSPFGRQEKWLRDLQVKNISYRNRKHTQSPSTVRHLPV